jgi:hypothetical protein
MPNNHDTPPDDEAMDIHDLVPADDDEALMEVYDIDLTEGVQERRRKINAHIQHVMNLIDDVQRGDATDPLAALSEAANITNGGGQAWLADVEALHTTLMYARSTRYKLQEAFKQLTDLQDAIAKIDTDHPLVKRIDEVLREYHEMDFDLNLTADIENTWNGMTKSAAFGILSALQGEPVGHRNAESVAYWLRHIAKRVEARQEQAS